MKEAEDFIISMAQKNRDNIEKQEELKTRHKVRRDFWIKMLPQVNTTCSLFQNVNPSKDHWLSAGSGMSGVGYTCIVTKAYVRIELTISGRPQEENKLIFDKLFSKKDKIETTYGNGLVWERMEDKRMSRVKIEKQGVSIFNSEDWGNMIDFLKVELPKFEQAFKKPLQEINRSLKAD